MSPFMAQPKSTISHSGRLLLQMLTNVPGLEALRWSAPAPVLSALKMAASPQPISVACS
jgi:hypothetical protein